MKKVLILLSGLFGFLFFESFARLIILFYHRTDFHFYGITYLPANVWIVVILLSVLVSTWLVSMLVLTLLKDKATKNALWLAVIFVLWRTLEILNTWHQEPIWYFVIAVTLHLCGIYLAWLLYTRQYVFDELPSGDA